MEPPSLRTLCLRTLRTSLEKGVCPPPDLARVPLGLCEVIFDFLLSSKPPGGTSNLSLPGKRRFLRGFGPHLSDIVATVDLTPVGVALSDNALREIAECCSSGLEVLNANGCMGISDEGVRALARSCQSLTRLSLCNCPLLTDEATSYLGGTQSLTALNLAGTPRLTGVGAARLITTLPVLERLSLARCSLVGDEVFFALAANNGRGRRRTNLRWLDLSGTGVTEAGACAGLGRGSLPPPPQLEYLSLSGTKVGRRLIATLAREIGLPAALPDAPKTVARSNRTLLEGVNWSKPLIKSANIGSGRRHRRSSSVYISMPSPSRVGVGLRGDDEDGHSGGNVGNESTQGPAFLSSVLEEIVGMWGHAPNPPPPSSKGAATRLVSMAGRGAHAKLTRDNFLFPLTPMVLRKKRRSMVLDNLVVPTLTGTVAGVRERRSRESQQGRTHKRRKSC
ncbi:unnamed protein product [Choristocarpus tenellus]